MPRRALITGITGQDGSYLAELLLEKGYEVHGLLRRSSSANQTWRIDPVRKRLCLHEGDLHDAATLAHAVEQAKPDEVYNLAAQSHVGTSFHSAAYTGEVDGIGAVRLFEVVRTRAPGARVYQASTSEMFGNGPAPQNEQTPLCPRSPYGCAKLYAHWSAHVARDAWGMRVSCGILFNHESPRRGEAFVSRKVARAVAEIVTGKCQEKVRLGNLSAERDWGHAREYVWGMWRMLQEDGPGDYVLATGESHTVRELVAAMFSHARLNYEEWVVEDSPEHVRPAEVNALRGDSKRAREAFGWCPRVKFLDLCAEMVDAEIAALQ